MSRIQQIFNSTWAIGRSDYFNLISILQPSINAGNFAGIEEQLNKDKTTIKAVNLRYTYNEWNLDDERLPDDSIAIIRMPCMLYSWDSESMAHKLEMAMANERIAGVIIKINGVGGMVDGIGEVTNRLHLADKPIVTLISGSCMSAHYWMASATDRRLLLDKGCQVGSIGIVGTYYNATEAMKKEGIDFREIYPDTADLKNREYRDIAESNNEEGFKKHLEQVHKLFCNAVSKNLAIPYNRDSPIFRGATFMGDEAIKAGLADGYGNIDEAARWILAQKVIRQAKDIV